MWKYLYGTASSSSENTLCSGIHPVVFFYLFTCLLKARKGDILMLAYKKGPENFMAIADKLLEYMPKSHF